MSPEVRGAATSGMLTLDWLTERRLRLYSRIAVALYTAMIIGWFATSDGLIDRLGKPVGTDFVSFFAAADLARTGDAAAAYDLTALHAAERAAAGGDIPVYPFAYPPSYLLLLLPLAALPYLPALALWLAATFAGFAAVLRRAAPHPATLWLALALPAGFINLLHGQNGFLIAALFGAAMLCLDRRPILAGLLIGLLTIKPHLGLLLPIALLAGGRWRAILAAGASALTLAAASAAVLGIDSWSAFLANAATARAQLEDGMLPWSKMHTVFAGARLLGLEVLPAYLLQGLVSLLCAVAIALAWSRPGPLDLRAALLGAGAVLASPYGFEYDLVLLALPGAWLAWRGAREGFLAGEKLVLLAVFILPFVTPALAGATAIPLAPPVLLAFLWTLWRRLAAARASDAAPSARPARQEAG